MFWLVLVFNLLIPVVMVIGGCVLKKCALKELNEYIGYRTSRSMKNQDMWKFANEYCGRLWCISGWILLLPSALVHIPFYGASEETLDTLCLVLMAVQIVVLLASILLTEKVLKKTFTEQGMRK